MAERKHRVSIIVGGKQIDGWTDYQIQSSMIVPADRFDMRRPFSADAWSLLALDSEIEVWIDSTRILTGFLDRRKLHDKEGVIAIGGLDRAGRLTESAPSINYQGLEMTEAIRRLASPWFSTVTLSDARNRRLRLGKGRKVPTGNEPIVVRRHTPNGGKVQPGQSRWQVIEEIVSQAGLMCWSSADGRELVVGRPNYQQAAQFVIVRGKPGGSVTTAIELDYEEDIGDAFSVIAVVGTGGGTTEDFGISVSSRRSVVYDAPTPDGTGGDFIHPKRLLMPEQHLESNQDSDEIAEREQARRNWKRRTATATMEGHGQFTTSSTRTIFAPNTISTVVQERLEPALRRDFLIYQCTYSCSRGEGETTAVELVPRGTEIVL